MKISEKAEFNVSEFVAKDNLGVHQRYSGTVNRKCTLLRIETIAAIKLHCQRDLDRFNNMMQRRGSLVSNDIRRTLNAVLFCGILVHHFSSSVNRCISTNFCSGRRLYESIRCNILHLSHPQPRPFLVPFPNSDTSDLHVQ